MKIKIALVIFIFITALGGYSDSIRFWKGDLHTADLCEGTCGFLLELGLWSSQILVLVGLVGAVLLSLSKPLAKPFCYTYFIGIFISILPAMIILNQRFGPVWMDSTIPYSWEILRLGWPLVGTGMLFLFYNANKS